MKPNFNEMSRIELLAYVKAHPDDDTAWNIYIDRLPRQLPRTLDEAKKLPSAC